MYCMKCNNSIGSCTCGDMEERLASLVDSNVLIYRKCLKCDKHYESCRCDNPEWGTSDDKRK
jgi:antirestriction protein